MTKLLLAATTALALFAVPAMADRYEDNISLCHPDYYSETTISLGKGYILIGETQYNRVTPILKENHWRHATYDAYAEGEPLGLFYVKFATRGTGAVKDLILIIHSASDVDEEPIYISAVACPTNTL